MYSDKLANKFWLKKSLTVVLLDIVFFINLLIAFWNY